MRSDSAKFLALRAACGVDHDMTFASSTIVRRGYACMNLRRDCAKQTDEHAGCLSVRFSSICASPIAGPRIAGER